jgi:hypothetical protein
MTTGGLPYYIPLYTIGVRYDFEFTTTSITFMLQLQGLRIRISLLNLFQKDTPLLVFCEFTSIN